MMIEVKPADGKKIRNPDLAMQHLAADAYTLVRWSTYWQQLIVDGDVVQKVEAKAEAPPKPARKSLAASA